MADKYIESDLEKVRREEREKRQNRADQNPFHFADRLNEAILAKKSALCVGLDPKLKQIPEFIRDEKFAFYSNALTAAAESIIAFNKQIIDSVCDLVPAVKLQIAFYEQYGHEGIRAFEETLWYAKDKGLVTIADIKRSDLGANAEAYAKAFLGKVDLNGTEGFSYDADAVTVSAYMGWDSVRPFLEEARQYGKGVFVMVKSANQSAADVQDLEMVNKLSIYEIMANYVDSWGADEIAGSGYSMLGAVVGVNFEDQARRLREMMPASIILVPGFGANGRSASDVKALFNADGLGALINVGSQVSYAYLNSDTFTEWDFSVAARQAVLDINEELAR